VSTKSGQAQSHTNREITLSYTKEHESMLIYDALSVVRFEPESFCAKVSKDHG
jgi:hypothetical protein